jgi:FAD/FMN-containing dehydrogenase
MPDTPVVSDSAWQELSRRMSGPLLRPEDDRFAALCTPATNRYARPRPQAIARCVSSTDVAHVINFARRSGLQTAVRGAGHSFVDHSSTTGLLIETGLMNRVQLRDDLATIGAGARLAEVYHALHQHGVTIPAGCGPTVGVAGLTLGGGLGVLGRTYGLTCDRLTEAEIVLADGTMITCSDDSDQDLYWALRGAGTGNFGVVTALTFRTIPEPQGVAIHLSWPSHRIPDILMAWLEWTPNTPDAIAASLVVRAPADPSIPPQAHLIGAFLADEPAANQAITRFEQLAGPALPNRRLPAAPISEVKTQLANIGAEVGAGSASAVDHSASEFYSQPLPVSVAAALIEVLATGRLPGQARELAFTPMGGAYNRVPPDATAFVHRDDEFLLESTVTSEPAEPTATPQAASQWLGAVRQSLKGHGSGRAYQNFPDPELVEPLTSYYGANLPRLRHIKARYDPDDFFHHGQSVPPRREEIR